MKSRPQLCGMLCILYLTTWGTNPAQARGYAARLPAHIEKPQAANVPRRPTPEAYNAMRDMFFRFEEARFLGADLELNDKELAANQIIMEAKIKEYEEGLATPHMFTPSQHFFEVLDKISDSPLFKYIAQMPKGGVLHAHDTALCSTDFIIKLTYRENLWGEYCDSQRVHEVSALQFSKSKPTSDNSCEWGLLEGIRTEVGAKKVDEYLQEKLSLYPVDQYLDNNHAWQQFMKIFSLLDGMLMYAPVWADYYYNALEEFYADGVQYLEFRTTLPTLYDLENTNYTELDTVRVYVETLNKFMAVNPGFIGSKMIYAPIRVTDKEGMQRYIDICVQIKEKYPQFVAGFDLVGQEESGGALKEYIPQLLSIPDNIDFYFHAGETNWFGSSVDENLIDAVLLGTKRIGHGFALVKHPLVLEMLKERNIAVEVNPISNQVLQLVSDFRNHPCSHYFADGYPVVISSDDPSFWRAAPLSHDFYIAFLGIASAHTDIRLLKKLAINSITYSSLSAGQKVEAFQKWQTQWDEFIHNVVDGESSAAQQRLITNKID